MTNGLSDRLRQRADELEARIPLDDIKLVIRINGLARVKSISTMIFHTANAILDLREAAAELGNHDGH